MSTDFLLNIKYLFTLAFLAFFCTFCAYYDFFFVFIFPFICSPWALLIFLFYIFFVEVSLVSCIFNNRANTSGIFMFIPLVNALLLQQQHQQL